MKRYDEEYDEGGYLGITEQPDGDWCRWEDAEKLADALEALKMLAGWVDRALLPNYTPRKPAPENLLKAMDAARTAIAQAEPEPEKP